MAGWIALGVAVLALVGFASLVGRFATARERYRGVAAVGISPVGALDHVEAAVRQLGGYMSEREDGELTITHVRGVDPATPLADAFEDVLHVRATRADAGTRVEIWGFAEPRLIGAIRGALARTPPWTRAI